MKLCVIGLGRFGYSLAVYLAEQGNEVLAVDKNESIIEAIRDHVTQAICADIKDEETLLAVGVEDIDTVIIGIGEDFSQSTLITALLKKKLQVPNVIARAMNDIHETVLKLVGANKVISLERNMALKLAHKLSMPIGELVHITDDFVTTQIKISKSSVGKKIKNLVDVNTQQVACIAVKKGGKFVLTTPEYVVLKDDVLVFAGSRKALDNLIDI